MKRDKVRSFQGGNTTKVVYVGTDGYKELCDKAIDISHKGGKQITPAQLNRYLITNYAEAAGERLIEEMKIPT
ncbi:MULTISPECIES: hypothetical protein [unclassified Pseudomonas]|uniref:hypothetical protein n=1 Tax=unclassified Pseudomonas TaxID=196821 RepID=UPI002AB34DD6|nr:MULTISPECIES: hypothetical protein [unclassified Pseudomonas]MDY7563436.1 hypothetical protein [Pseudomonas sp. AB6]MEA9979994.1 hypothetical protein [Pseudomonas sp. RTS4]MEA9996506.1 hypothetical protein [Pseudomonas sp. AA4]MEB0198176.1 hypothetical protein [Pseudomonas sp. 5S4]MEB0213412.1 hypothetical protein [Pseudomonas sp. AB6]